MLLSELSAVAALTIGLLGGARFWQQVWQPLAEFVLRHYEGK